MIDSCAMQIIWRAMVLVSMTQTSKQNSES